MANNVILFDIDGVLADFRLAFTKLGVKMGLFPAAWLPLQPLAQCAWDFPLVSPAQKEAVWEKIKQDPWFWTELESLVDKDTFADIRDLGYDHSVYFVTSRP